MKWFKHQTSMRHDPRIKRVVRKYGADGYALYNYILESIAGNLNPKDPLPNLEETSEDIAYDLKLDTLRVQEIVGYCLEQGLFSQDEVTGHILCLKMYKFLDDATRKSSSVVNMLNSFAKINQSDKVGQIPKDPENVLPELDKDLELDPDKDKEEDKELKEKILSDEFTRFWNLYDKKKDKDKCYSKWKKIPVKDKLVIFEVVKPYVDSTPDKKFRKNPLTYLNGKCWNDEIINNNNQKPGGMKKNGFDKEYYQGEQSTPETSLF